MQNMIRTACPQCGKVYELEDEYLGSTVQCECGKQFTVKEYAPTGKRKKNRQPLSGTYIAWFTLFAVQYCGYLIGCLINMAIDSALIAFMIDDSWVFSLVRGFVLLAMTAAASLLAMKILAKQLLKD